MIVHNRILLNNRRLDYFNFIHQMIMKQWIYQNFKLLKKVLRHVQGKNKVTIEKIIQAINTLHIFSRLNELKTINNVMDLAEK